MSRVCVRSGRFHFCTILIVAGFAFLSARLFQLQVIQSEEIAAESNSIRKRLVRLEAKRGDILDREGNLLAGTRSRIKLGVDPTETDPREAGKLTMLAGMLDMPVAELVEKFSRRERIDSKGRVREVQWVPIAEIEDNLYEKVQELDVSGVYGTRFYERYYPGKQLGAHVVGYLNKAEQSVMGVEQALDFYLRGQAGWRETEVDGRRRELAAFREREVEPRNGLHVQLTIDLVVQSTIEAALEKVVAESSPDAATIIVSDPSTGEIYGLANYPTFDPNSFWEFPLENQRNRALSDQYEPGSTFKIVPVSAALEEGILDPDSQIDCGVEHKVYNGVNIPMPSDHRNLGVVPLRTVVSKSSNRGAAQIGMLLGEERLFAYAHRFGFGQSVDWPLAGVASGTLLPVEDWDGYTISRLPTGYAVGATPMQIHLAMATLANSGVRVTPRILSKVIDPVNGTEIALGPDKRERVLSERTAHLMQEMLLDVVSPEGTARNAELPGFEVAGKTGTARKIIDGQYSHSNHLGSFTGFFPASKPKVVITVMIDNAHVSGPAYGGVVAAPVFREIGEKLIPHLAIRKPSEWEPFIVSND